MATITLEFPDELVPHLNALGDRLPTLLQQCLQAPLLQRSKAETLTLEEQAELDEYERIEHMIVMLKAGNLSHLTEST